MNILMFVSALMLLISLPYVLTYDPIKVTAFMLMGLVMSTISIIVYYRKLEFLTAESVHISLFAVTLSYILNFYFNLPIFIPAIMFGLLIIYLSLYMVHRGLGQEKASAVIVSSTSALSVISIYYVLTTIPAQYSLSSIMLGDPLLLTRSDSLLAIFFSVALFFVVMIFLKEIIETSIDPVSASLTGIRVRFYDLVTYTAIGLSSIVFLRLAGYVMEHVLMLLPAIASTFYSSSSREHVVNTLLLGVSASAAGFAASIYLNTAPTGLTGIIILITFIIGFTWRRKR
ncbi:MAG: metal ABC transporter permease [Desulfurococcaceae archaeon]